jgi:hypothetical protein
MREERLVVFDPTDEAVVERWPIARVAGSLEGKVVGFLDNSKENVEALLAGIQATLTERVAIAGAKVREKPHHSRPAAPELIEELADGCAAVITAVAG